MHINALNAESYTLMILDVWEQIYLCLLSCILLLLQVLNALWQFCLACAFLS